LDDSRNDLGADGGPHGRIDVLAPFATIVASVSKAPAPATIAFDASGSADEWGIHEYAWDFDAVDGIGIDATGAMVEYTYSESGFYTVTLRVTDHNGHSASTTASIEVQGGAPTVAIEADTQAGPTPLKINLDALGTDPEGGQVTFQWDFDGDGITDDTNSSTKVVFGGGTAPGSYKIALTGTDPEDLSAQASLPVTVSSGPVKGKGKVKPNEQTTIQATADGKSIVGAQIVLPAGSVSEPVYVTISEPTLVPDLPEATSAFGIIAIDPDGLVLSLPAAVDLPVAVGLSGGDYDVIVYNAKKGEWTDAPIANVSVTGDVISFTTTRLGIFAVVESAGPMPVIDLTQTAHSVSESANQVTLTVTMNPALTAAGSVTVRYLTANDSAQSGSDYVSTTGTLTFDAGKSTNTIAVPILEDLTAESNETFRVILTDVQGAVLGQNATASITIVDNDESSAFGQSAPAGCNAGSIGTGSSNPPADFLILALLVSFAAFGGRLLKRPSQGYASGPVAFS
jgi:PKD repeat protein